MGSLIICMAGLNTRFHDVGFDVPKYLLPWRDTCIVAAIVDEFQKDYEFDDVLLLANKRDQYFKNDLVKEIEKIGLSEKNIHYIGDTNGQAHTAYIGATLVKDEHKPMYVHNADTFLTNRNFKEIEEKLTGITGARAYVDIFVANNPNYSYVKKEEKHILDIVEKDVISPFASSGLYCFHSAYEYKGTFENINNSGEIYIANIISAILNNNSPVMTNELVKNQETIVLGSPEEYSMEYTKWALKKRN